MPCELDLGASVGAFLVERSALAASLVSVWPRIGVSIDPNSTPGQEDMIFGGIRFLPDGDLLNFSPTSALRPWDLETCRQLAVLDGPRLSPPGIWI